MDQNELVKLNAILYKLLQYVLDGGDAYRYGDRPSDDMVIYFLGEDGSSGGRGNNSNFTNCYLQFGNNGYVDIYPHKIELAYDSHTVVYLNPKNFANVTDEEVFMQSTIQDLSMFDSNIEVLKGLIKVAKLAEVNSGV